MRHVLLVSAIVFAAACGGDDKGDAKNNTPGTPGLRIGLEPGSATVLVDGDGTDVTVRIYRDNIPQDTNVTLSVSQPPNGVSAAFDTTTTTAPTVTLHLGTQALLESESTFTLTVTAAADTLTTSQYLSVALTFASSFSVHGHVEDFNRASAPGYLVELWDNGGSEHFSTFSDETGAFDFYRVGQPYDVLVTSDGAQTLFMGVRPQDVGMRNPVFGVGSVVASAPTSITGAFGGSYPVHTYGTVSATCSQVAADSGVHPVTATYSLDLRGPLAPVGEDCLFESFTFVSNDAGATATAYSGYAAQRARVTPTSSTAPTMTPSGSIAGRTVTVQSDVPMSLFYLIWTPADRGASIIGIVGAPGTMGTVYAPDDARIPVSIVALWADATGQGRATAVLAPGQTTVSFTRPTATASAAGGPSSATFTASAGTNDFQIDLPTSRLDIITHETTLTNEQLAAHGVELVSGTYNWRLIQRGLANAPGGDRGFDTRLFSTWRVDGATLAQTPDQTLTIP